MTLDRRTAPLWGWTLGVIALLFVLNTLDKQSMVVNNLGTGAQLWMLVPPLILIPLSAIFLKEPYVRWAGLWASGALNVPIALHFGDHPRALQSPVLFGVVCLIGLVGPLMLLTGNMRKALSYWLLFALALFLVAPFLWMLLISLHPPKSPIPPISEILPRGMPAHAGEAGPLEFHWENYDFVLNHPTLPVGRFFLNSIVVTVTCVLGQLFLSSLAAFGFARIRFKGREPIFALFLGSMMFAGPVTQIPVFLFLRNLGWLDTYMALIVPGISSAFSVFLLRQFFLQIPFELDEAARIDGAGDFRIYWRVIMPLSKAALATSAAFSFFGVWTDFFNPLIFTTSTEMRTLEVGLSIFKNSYGGTNWPLQMTAAVIVMTPLLLVFLYTQRFFTKGITLGSIK